MADTKISALISYTPALDADVLPIVDTANTLTKKITWANIKATLKTYFDTLYALVSGNVITIGTATLTLGASKAAVISSSITFTGTDTTTMTFPSTSATIARTDAANTFTGASTASAWTLTSPNIQTLPVYPTGTNLILTVPTVDDTATGEITNAYNSGYSSSAIGDLVYLDSSATWQKADADASATTYGSGPLGIALEVKASGNALKVLLRGFAYCSTAFPTFTIGGAVYMSATAGAVTQTAPVTTDSATRVLGHAVHADKIWFNPSSDYITHV